MPLTSPLPFPSLAGEEAAFDWQVNSQVALLFYYVSSAASASGALARTGELKPIFRFRLYQFVSSS